MSDNPPREKLKVTAVPLRTWLLWIAILGGIILLMLFREHLASQVDTITQYKFNELLDAGQILRATINYDPQNAWLNEIVGKYSQMENGMKKEIPFRTRVRLTAGMEQRLLSLPQFEPRQPNTMLLSVFWSILPVIVIALLIWFFFIRQIKRISRNSPTTADLQARASSQQDRLDKILDKWEAQAQRMDAVLDKLERPER